MHLISHRWYICKQNGSCNFKTLLCSWSLALSFILPLLAVSDLTNVNLIALFSCSQLMRKLLCNYNAPYLSSRYLEQAIWMEKDGVYMPSSCLLLCYRYSIFLLFISLFLFQSIVPTKKLQHNPKCRLFHALAFRFIFITILFHAL